jgi:predicted dehydrogenase
MGHAHARAYARLCHHYPDLDVTPVLVAVADPVETHLMDFARRYGAPRTYADWHALLDDPDVEVVSVTTPNALHREIGVAVASAGKHLWIEKPVGLTTADARAVAEAVAAAGVQSAVGFNYRNVPAVARARSIVHSGLIGTPTHARVVLRTDYAAHPAAALTWRFARAQGGHGVLGDLASHAVDLVRHLLGDVVELVADTAVFIAQRPVAGEGTTSTGEVENEDYVSALLRTGDGVRVTLEASRVAVGDQNAYGFHVHGTKGFVGWDFRRPGELVVSAGEAYVNQPAQTVFAGPDDGEYARFQPNAGIALSYDDSKVIEAAAFVRSVHTGTPHGATLADAVRSAEALDAMVESAKTHAWVKL